MYKNNNVCMQGMLGDGYQPFLLSNVSELKLYIIIKGHMMTSSFPVRLKLLKLKAYMHEHTLDPANHSRPVDVIEKQVFGTKKVNRCPDPLRPTVHPFRLAATRSDPL